MESAKLLSMNLSYAPSRVRWAEVSVGVLMEVERSSVINNNTSGGEPTRRLEEP
jgi:hypothetical protein